MIRACPSCGQKNRLPAARLSDEGRCGRCKAALPAASAPLDVTAEELEEIVAGARVPVLVDFWAAWCGPCQMAAPEVKKTAQQMAGRALVLKVDTERNPAASARYGIRGIPHFMVFEKGQPVFQQSGLVGHSVMNGWLERAGA